MAKSEKGTYETRPRHNNNHLNNAFVTENHAGQGSRTANSPEYEHSDEAPPPYDHIQGVSGDVEADGRVDIDMDSRLSRILRALVDVPTEKKDLAPPPEYTKIPPWNVSLNVVIQVVGSRGDVQPFIALGNELQKYGHRVRLATHDVFRDFVTESNLEFYPIGGDPAELMSYMVQNPGLIPSMKSLREGEIKRKREMISEMLQGCWKACIEPNPVTGTPFVADAIIANPPSFAHVHCAQALGVPVHIMFTMPWTATREFPHPLANIRNAKGDPGLANYLSYGIVEILTWQGLGDVINNWRESIDLEPVPATEAPFLTQTLKIPHTYCWSAALVSKPADWESHIDVCGFFFREEPRYEPPPGLEAFLAKGSPPIYVGFGSIVVSDPERLTAVVLEAIEKTGVRAVIARGWSNLGKDLSSSDNVYFLGDCPHEWLFQHVSAVFHHGGAGTTACGLRNARPTAIIPFFGDQPFWGEMVAAAGAGPKPIKHKALNVDNLTAAIRFCLTAGASAAVQKIASNMATENGVRSAAASFHRNLPLEGLTCDILPGQAAVWAYKAPSKKIIRLSKFAAEVLIEYLRVDAKKLLASDTYTIQIINKRWDPITGGASALIGSVTDTSMALGAMIRESQKEYNRNEDLGEGSSSSAGSSKPSRIAAVVGKNLGKASGSLLKGITVDIPFAFAEGLHGAPRLYGEKVQEHGQVTDWKSGAAVAGKSFAHGMYDGITGIVMRPINGGREEGALGVAKGVGQGVMGAYWKTTGALAALWGYPMQGIYKSIYSAIHSKTRKQIAAARHEEGMYLRKSQTNKSGVDVQTILSKFDSLARMDSSSRT